MCWRRKIGARAISGCGFAAGGKRMTHKKSGLVGGNRAASFFCVNLGDAF